MPDPRDPRNPARRDEIPSGRDVRAVPLPAAAGSARGEISAWDRVLQKVPAGTRLRTPDAKVGSEFVVDKVDAEGVDVKTQRGGRIRISLFTFETAVKFLRDHAYVGDRWVEVKDEDFQMLLNMENDRVRAASYILSILGAAGVIDVDGGRPNKVRLAR